MASHFPARSMQALYEKQLRRNRLRKILLETLERRELLASDIALAHPIFAEGTGKEYREYMESQLAGNAGDSGVSDGFNTSINARWTDPVGGPSPNEGDPATITWSLVPDGTVDSANNSTTNLIAFMDSIYGGGTGPVEQRPWFNIFQRAYDSWSELSGLNFVYEANDDGVPISGTNRGVDGVRGDVRIGGRNVDGNFGVLAFNYYPTGGGNSGWDGDMIIDTNDSWFVSNADSAAGENRGLFNVLMHEAGHGVGLGHSIPINQTKLMEPNASFAFLGAQHDDILGAHKLYGDNAEPNDSAGQAVDLGILTNGRRSITGNSIDRPGDDDWYSFTAEAAGRISLTLDPVGFSYQIGNQNGTTGPVNTLLNQDLLLELVSGGTVLAQASATAAGETEEIVDFDLPAGGNYQIRIAGVASASSDPQMYDLSIRASGLSGGGDVVTPPRLLSIAPNVGQIFSFNRTDEITQAPNELQFRFNGSQLLDPSSFDGIRITRAGHDSSFGDGNEVVIEPGFIGFGDSERTIIARFSSPLPDDLYRIEVFAVDDANLGVTAVRNVNGEALLPRVDGSDRDTIFFDLELGNQVVAIVPQPTSRDVAGDIVQARDQIEVYFSDQDRMFGTDVTTGDITPNPTVVDPSFYRLFSDKGTSTNTDDLLFLPTSIEYSASRNMAVLTFAGNIDELDPDFDTAFRLRVGTNEPVPAAPTIVSQTADPGSTFDVTPDADLGVLSAITSFEISEQIVNSTVFPLDFPGAPDTPGTREILDDPSPGESHVLGDNPDSGVGLVVQQYNFNKVDPVSFDPETGQPIFNSISPQQEQRAREIFEIYGSILGIQFVETETSGWTIATANIDGVGGTIGVANGVSAIMDAAESWNDEFGANDEPTKFSWFVVAMHEIGHLLGLGHATHLPPGTIQGGAYSNTTLGGAAELLSGNPVEPVFPGAADSVAAKYLHRPDSRDIDMYRFEVAPGSAGVFTAEVVAERLPDSSLLDSVLSLYRELPDGSRQVIAVNDDYFSEDSYMKLDLQPGVYYLGVSASGNTDYDPSIADSGLGGTTEGAYQIRATFRPLEANSIVDVEGTPLDGDADGQAGGVFDFWFNAAAPEGMQTGQRRALFVDKATGSTGGDGSLGSPFLNIDDAFAAAQPGDVVRIVGNGGADGDLATIADNLAFEVGTGGLGNQPLADGSSMNVPRGVTVVIDEGALFKMGRSTIGIGSSTSSGDRSKANLQVLGTPEQEVFFTSYTDESAGVDTDPLSTTPGPGDWGGIIFRNALDRAEGRFDAEFEARFVNYVGYANMTYGGGQVPVDGQNRVITPLHMTSARPTLINNTITRSAFAGMSADPNSFQESTFTTERFQADTLYTPGYNRLGPDIRGNTVVENSLNGLFVRIETAAGQVTAAQTVAAHWDDTDIVHIVADTLTVAGTPGGPLLEQSPPELSVVQISDGGNVTDGQLMEGTAYSYRMTFVDANGNEGVASTATQDFVVPVGSNAIRLSDLPSAPSQFVARKVYRSDDGGTTYRLVAELDRSSTVLVDSAVQTGEVINDATTLFRARQDANLVIAPGTVVKLQGGRLRAGVSAQIVAEGREGLPVVFTSRQDDRFGAGGTFDTNSDSDATLPQPGDWGGIYFGHAGSGSIDHSLITFGGGETSVGGGFAGFNAVEIHQSDVRISNSVIENNADGTNTTGDVNRDGALFNEASAIFVRGSQPVIVDNIIRDNEGVALSIDPQSMTGNTVKDKGRVTGRANRRAELTSNKGPLLRGNSLGGNDLNGMEVRGATMTTESVWDDADIVHIVMDEIIVPDLYVFGGMRLQSSSNESLVVKFGPGAGLTSNGRPLDIEDRIGGTLQVIGAPGFPVVLTSLSDNTIGAGFDPDGRAQTDTDNSGGAASAGDWRGLRIDEFSNDRNVAIATELEPAQATGSGVNGGPGTAQLLGKLATGPKASDDNLRIGYTVAGTINNRDDIDVYSFEGTAGTEVWFDIDRTSTSLDAVIELIDSNGNIIAQSDNSLDESTGALPIFSDAGAIDPAHVNPMQLNAQGPRNFGSGAAALGNTFADFYSTNPLDPGLRLILPGATGSVNNYFVRVRSSNIDSREAGVDRTQLQDPSKINGGLTEGQYQLQIRLRAIDDYAGSSVSFADIRYATNGVEILGGPYHSPLLGEAVELTTDNNTIANALDLGNLLNTDQAALSLAGDLNEALDIDWYRFEINQDTIQTDGLVQHVATMIDVDYADGLGRANTSLWLFYDDQNGLGAGTNTGIRLVNFGTDSNIADDIGAPLNGSDTDDLSRGSAGLLDAFIGSTQLPAGTYYLAITASEQISNVLSQFYAADAGGNPLARVEPINSVVRVIEDRLGGGTTTASPPLQTAFTGNANAVPYTLGDLPLFISRSLPGDTSQLLTVDALVGTQTSLISSFENIEDIAMRGDGVIHAARRPTTGVINDASHGGILQLDAAGDGASTVVAAASGLQTFDVDFSVNPPAVAAAFSSDGNRNGSGMTYFGLTYPQEGNDQFLYAVGSRATGVTSFQTFNGPRDARNYVYKLDPTTLQAISAPQNDRTDGARINGAGTQVVERGYIDTSREVNTNATYQTIIMSAASPVGEPSLLDGDLVTVQTPTGNVVFEWTAADPSATLIADTSPQADVNNFPPTPNNFFRDGQTFTLTAGATTNTFEIETGRVLVNNFAVLNPDPWDGSTFVVVDADGDIVTFEFDDGGGVTAPNVPVVYDAANSTQLQVSQAIVAAINNAALDPTLAYGDGSWDARAALLPSTNRVSVFNDSGLMIGNAVGTADVDTNPPTFAASTNNPLTISELGVTAGLGAGQTYDGATFTITDLDGDVLTFEYDTDAVVTVGNIGIPIQDTSTANFIEQATISAINFPGGAVPPAFWDVAANAANDIRLTGDTLVTITASTATVVNPLTGSAEYGNVDALSGNLPVVMEEYFTNLDDNQFLPIPSTPGAMDELIAAINGSAMGITATSQGTRLILSGADALDFSNISTITTNTSTGGTNIPLPFSFTDSAFQLNATLLAAVQTVEPGALQMNDGRIWLPETSSFLQFGTDDRYDNPSKNALFSEPQYGIVTGLAMTGDNMWGVSNNGDLYRVGSTFGFNPNSPANNGDFIETIYNTNTGNRVNFVSLTSGPRNAESGGNFTIDGGDLGLDDVLFGLDNTGRMYAFDTQGRPARVFPDGDWILQTQSDTATSVPNGIAFSNIDINLWHSSRNRADDAGHGINISFDGSRRNQSQGGNSFYFGFENPTNPSPQPGDWSGVNNPGGNFPGYDATLLDSYDFPGGVRGALVSDTIDLSDYGPGDKPFLYFNYYLETEDSNANNPGDNNFMTDAFRVFASGSDGQWQLLGTNNSDYDAQRGVGQRDELDYPFEVDINNAQTRQVVELFDVNANGAPDGWRQARIDLSRFAGDPHLRIRYEFSTSGSMDTGSVGGVELVAVPAADLNSGDTFTIDGTNFEFDMGLVLNIPSGARLAEGETFEIDGVTYTFSLSSNAGTDVLFAPSESAATVAARIAAKINGQGLSAAIDPVTLSRISVIDSVNPTPAISAGLPPSFIADVPGTTGVPVPVSVDMTAPQVRDSIRASLAQVFNIPGQEGNVDVIRFHLNAIRLFGQTINNPGPLGATAAGGAKQGDEYGEPISGTTGQVGQGAQRGQNNRFEGVYVDDIIIGFAERGEMVTYTDNSATEDTAFVENPWHEPAPGFAEIETGTYQIEIRRGPNYGIGGTAFPSLGLFQSFDTNDRGTTQTSFIAPSGAEIFDGQTFDLSDGVNIVTFEFDDVSIVSGPSDGIAQGNVAIPFDSSNSRNEVALAIRNAINSPESQAVLDIVAGLSDGAVTGTNYLNKPTTSHVVHLHGNVASDNFGSQNFIGTRQTSIAGAATTGYVLYGVDNFRLTEQGDSNRLREQGQILVHSNIVRDSSGYGIRVDAGARTNPGLIPLAGALPHPGSVRNLVQFNQADLTPGPVLVNNLVYANAIGGILFSGDTRAQAQAEAPVPFGRLLNNTVVGLNGTGIGIQVTDFASPTLLNNIVAGLATGISVDASSNTTVVGATTYQNNGANTAGIGLGTDPQVLSPTEPLFVDASGRNYYLADNTRAIDASIDSLNDRQSMTTVRDPLGISVSPILAPDTDLTGQLRVDDPDISNPNGTGGNPFKDRGAYDRSDFFGPTAIIQQPLDNDPDGIDTDGSNTFIQLNGDVVEALDFFSILLFEAEGTGPDATTVTSDAVVITENGRRLRPGEDYIFGYNPSSRLIRLTPFSGIWRNDSVYEITLNNQDGIRVSIPAGAAVTDGDMVTVSVGTTDHVFELDSNGSTTAGNIPILFDASMSAFDISARFAQAMTSIGLLAYVQGDDAVMVHGADSIAGAVTQIVPAITDVADNKLQANRINSLTQFTIVMPEVELDYGDALSNRTLRADNGSRHALLPIDAAPLAIGGFGDADPDGVPSSFARADDNEATLAATTIPGLSIGNVGQGILNMPAPSAGLDGQQISISDALRTVVFEFDSDASATSGTIAVNISAATTANDVATAFANSVFGALLAGQIDAVSPDATGATVDLGVGPDQTVDVSTAPDVSRTILGRFELLFPATGYAAGQHIEILDGRGETTRFVLQDIGTSGITVEDNVVNVVVDITNATPDEIVQGFADAINARVSGGFLALGPSTNAGSTLVINGDDEEGVHFGGLFNSQSAPVEVTVESTGSGFLDVWIDWNQDGSFTGTGERILTEYPVQAGTNTFEVVTPASAITGFTSARFRLSRSGDLGVTNVAIGGEVEDHLIEIVAGIPPQVQDDEYSVLEDGVLTVAAPGVLANDSDPDSATFTVRDEDLLTPGIQPVTSTTRGTLVLLADGSFTYTPDPDFYGTDSFVYNAIDNRLSSGTMATVTITVNQVNDQPTATDDQMTLFEDESITFDSTVLTSNDFRGVFGTPSQTNELTQDLTVISATILHPNPGTFGGSIVINGDQLTFVPPANYNDTVDGPVLIEVTVQDDGQTFNTTSGMLEDDFLTDVSTLTINITPLNDSPEYDMPGTITVVEDSGAQVVDPFLTNIAPGPSEATDEAAGPGTAPENQTVSFTANALDPSLFSTLPTIDATGVLNFELAPNVTNLPPFPPEILVEVLAVDTGSGETILRNLFDPAAVTSGLLNTYDGATLTVSDNNGNTVVFEFDDAALPGTGTTNGVPHLAIPYDGSDTTASIETKLLDALNNPPAVAIDGGGTWGVHAFVDAITGEIRLTGESATVSTAGSLVTTLTNLFIPLNAGETYDGATFTITDPDGDTITFELNDTTDTAPAVPGVDPANSPIDYDPTFTANQLSQAIHAAINAPDAGILGGLTGTWDVVSNLPAASDQLQLSNVDAISLSASAAPIINPLATATYTMDNPLASRPAHDAVPRTFTILVDPVNDAPEFDMPVNPIELLEDAGPQLVDDFVINAAAGPGDALDERASQTLTLTVVAADPTAFTTQPSASFDAVAGTADLQFELAPDVNNATGHDLTILVTLMDDGGTANGGTDSTTQTLTLSVTPVNDSPSFSLPNSSVTVFEDNEAFTGTDPTLFVGFAEDVVQGPSTAVDETTLPATQQSVNFVVVSVSDPTLFDVQPEISPTGDLTFKTATDRNGSAEVVVRLLDDGPDSSTGNGDSNQSVTDQTFTINITPVNDAPTFDIPATADSIEDQGPVLITDFATNLFPGNPTSTDEAGQTFVVDVVAADPSAFTVQPDLSADGTLTYQTGPDVNADNADLRVFVTLTDDGTAGPAPHNNTSVTKTFTIAAAPINDAPLFSLDQNQVTVIEDAEAFDGTTVTTIPGVASGAVPGPATATDEAGQTLAYEVISVSSPELFSQQPTVTLGGDLVFKTAAHRNGSSLVVLRLVDDGVGSPAPNDNTSVLRTLTVTLTPINDAPEFNLPTSLTINEDAGLFSQSGFATNVRRGPVGTDDENSQQVSFNVFPNDPAAFQVQPAIAPDGTLTFQTADNVNSLNADLEVRVVLTDNGADAPAPNANTSIEKTFTIVVNPVNDPPIPDSFSETTEEDTPITIAAADVLAGDLPGPADELGQSLVMTQIERTSAQGGTITPVFNGGAIESFTYTPPTNLSVQDTFLYVVTDDGSPARAASGTITINITGINDPPQFTKGSNQVVLEDAGDVTVANWASGILAGPPAATDEHASQTVSFTLSSSNPGLFDQQPEVSADGTLTFRPAVDANGSAVVSIFATDDGSNVAPNSNMSPTQTFTITVTPVNDAPAFTAGADVTVDEDSGAYSGSWATGIVAASGLLSTPATANDEAGQAVSFNTTNSNPNLFALQPSINSSGLLEFTPAPDANGVAVVSVTAVDNGPTGGMNENSSAQQTFTITLTPVNDAPQGIGDTYSADEDNVLSVANPGIIGNDQDVDLPNDTLTAVAATSTSNLGAVVVINADGSFTYDPTNVATLQQMSNGQSVLDAFTYEVEDASGLRSTATVSINVAGIDDPPIANDDAYSMGVGQSRLLDILSNDTDIDTAIDPRTIVITTLPVSGSAVVNQTGVVDYTAGAGFRGIDTFGYTVRDGAGNLSNEAFVTITINNAPVATDDSTFTFKNVPVDIDILGNDSDLDGTLDPNSVQIVSSPFPGGQVDVQADGSVVFTPATDFFGDVQFSYVVADNIGTVSNVADVLIRVQRSLWQNPSGNLDVNGDGFVSPIDALLIVNYLNTGGETFLPDSGITPAPYLDPNGDENVTPIDALVIINFLNTNSAGGGGEGESLGVSQSYVQMVTAEQIIATVGPQVVADVKSAFDSSLESLHDEDATLPIYGPVMPESSVSLSEDSEEDDRQGDLLDRALEELFDDDFEDFIGPRLPR